MSADSMMMLIMFGIFVTVFTIVLAIKWYNKNHTFQINPVRILLLLFALIFLGAWLFFKKIATSEKTAIIQNTSLKNKVVDIQWDKRKPYFKDMKLDNGKWLPMPEEMNDVLQVDDSIYKNEGADFYTVVNAKTKARRDFKVQIHERVMGKAQ